MVDDTRRSRLRRRDFLRGGFSLTALTLAGRAAARPAPPAAVRQAEEEPPVDDGRLERAFAVRVEAAKTARAAGSTPQAPNGDEEEIPGHAACFTKGLPHGARGEVDPAAYGRLLRALSSESSEDFESVPLGGFARLANPQASFAFDLMGLDACQPSCAAPPRFASAEQAAEMAELYWQALARDIPFAEYESDPLIARAAADLARLSGYRGPREAGGITPSALFRGTAAGDVAGPYISQFLWKTIPFSPIAVDPKIRTTVPGVDYLTSWDDWLRIQNGALAPVNRFDKVPRYIRNGRDLGEYDHRDFTYQAFLGACLILLKLGALPDGGNPYKHSRTQSAFTTFGAPAILHLLATVTQSGLKACWYQKWKVHRRLRPEEYGGRVEAYRAGRASAPLPGDLLASDAVAATVERHGTALLPQAYPEGAPLHPSYPSGHAVIAGACSTVLKAFFDESFLLPDPVEARADGLTLRPWRGAALTVGGELDKLASNVALGRNFAGIHWRTDAAEGLRLGETVALAVLREQKLTGSELFHGFSLKTFAGERITI